jgi:cell division topological specificity factor
MAWFNRLSPSKDVAKQRLKLVLIHDRNDLSPALMQVIRRDIVQAISKYVEIDTNSLEVDLTRVKGDEGDFVSALVASIPITGVKNMSYR